MVSGYRVVLAVLTILNLSARLRLWSPLRFDAQQGQDFIH